MESKRKAHQIANCELCERVFNRPEPLPICQVCEKYLKTHGWVLLSNFERCAKYLHQTLWEEFKKSRPDLDLPETVEFLDMKEIIHRANHGG